MKRHKSIPEALQHVADRPEGFEAPVNTHVWELVARKLFDIANSPDPRNRGSMARATKAQKIILDRLVGRRRPGSHPAQVKSDEIEFVDLTMGVLPDQEKESV